MRTRWRRHARGRRNSASAPPLGRPTGLGSRLSCPLGSPIGGVIYDLAGGEHEALAEHGLRGHDRVGPHREYLVFAREELVQLHVDEAPARPQRTLSGGQGLEILAVHDETPARSQPRQPVLHRLGSELDLLVGGDDDQPVHGPSLQVFNIGPPLQDALPAHGEAAPLLFGHGLAFRLCGNCQPLVRPWVRALQDLQRHRTDDGSAGTQVELAEGLVRAAAAEHAEHLSTASHLLRHRRDDKATSRIPSQISPSCAYIGLAQE
mmetsp:Transcript_16320/g.48600  ORF Transcript_16320/g.48600 Transcript_16320/m.48600 type:complete len:263 (+) Transcript_16320:21-809(+)